MALPNPTMKRDARYLMIKAIGSGTADVASLLDGAGASHTITVTGAELGDFVLGSCSVSVSGLTVTAQVTAADTVTFRVQNESGGTVDLASATWRAVVFSSAVGT